MKQKTKIGATALVAALAIGSTTAHGATKKTVSRSAKPGRLTVSPPKCTPVGPEQRVRLDFEDSTVSDFLRQIGAQLCVGFMVHDDVRSRPVHVVAETEGRELWPLLVSSLRAAGAAVLGGDDRYEVIAATNMTRSATPLYGLTEAVPEGDLVISKVIRAPSAKQANTVSNYLNIFKSRYGQIHPYPGGLIVVTDFASSVRRLVRIMDLVAASPSNQRSAPRR